MNALITFITSSVRLGTTFLFGSTGETITEKAGHLNLGTPGVLCVGAVSGVLGATLYVGAVSEINGLLAVFITILCALVGAGLLGLLYSFLTVSLRSNQNVTGLMITTFGVGIAKFVKGELGTDADAAISKVAACFRHSLPFAEHMGWFGEIFFSYGILVYLAILTALLTSFFFKRTRAGLHLRAVGENPATADAAGINITRYRYLSTIIGCAVSGLGGLSFIFDYVGGWDSGLVSTEALGWLAVALVIFTLWNPNLGILGSVLFSALYILPNYLNVGFAVRDLISGVPYLVTIIVLVITSMRKKRENQPPANLGLNYFREER